MIRALAFLVSATPAFGGGLCLDHLSMVTLLDREYSESQVITAYADGGQLISFFLSHAGTWTQTYSTNQDGILMTCVLATGTSFMSVDLGQID